MNNRSELAKKIKKSRYTVVLTGYSRLSQKNEVIDKIFIKDLLHTNPTTYYEEFWKIIKNNFNISNPIHNQFFNTGITVITQNVLEKQYDTVNYNLIELHGSVSKMKCTKCDYLCDTIDLFNKKNINNPLINKIVHCPICYNLLRPDIVLNGEHLKKFIDAVEEIHKADLLLILETDLDSWPTNTLISKANRSECDILVIDTDDISNYMRII